MALREHPILLKDYLQESMSIEDDCNNFLQLTSPPESVQDWTNLFKAQCVQLPPSTDTLMDQEQALNSNQIKTIPFKVLESIAAKDFEEFGRFRHIYIGRQPSVPPEVYKILKVPYPDNPDVSFTIWRRLYKARMEAVTNVTRELPLKEWEKSPWLQMLSDSRITKTFQWDQLDVMQYWWAHHDISYQKLQTEIYPNLYHNFVRPLERLFALGMPLNEKLQQALLHKDATDDLGTFILKLIGWESWPLNLNAVKVIEELSRIRATPKEDFHRRSDNDAPIYLHKKIFCSASKTSVYKEFSIREELRRKGIKLNKIFRTPTKEENDELLSELVVSIREAIDEHETIQEQTKRVRIKKGYTIQADTLLKLESEEQQLRDSLGNNRITLMKLWRDLKSKIEYRASQRYGDRDITSEDLQKLEDKSSTELLRLYQIDKDSQKELVVHIREPKKKLMELNGTAIGYNLNIYNKDMLDEIAKYLNQLKTHETEVRETLHEMDCIHHILEARGIPSHRYEREWKVLQRMKRQAPSSSASAVSGGSTESTLATLPPKKRLTPTPEDKSSSQPTSGKSSNPTTSSKSLRSKSPSILAPPRSKTHVPDWDSEEEELIDNTVYERQRSASHPKSTHWSTETEAEKPNIYFRTCRQQQSGKLKTWTPP
jgi:hypothetical protein